MEKIQNSKILKTISYGIIPIFVLIIIVHIFSLSYYEEYQEENSNRSSYFETERFAYNYFSALNRAVDSQKSDGQYITETTREDIETEENIQYYGLRYNRLYDILIINKNGIAYTNIDKTTKTDSIEKIKKYIEDREYTWIYDKNEIKTNIEQMKYNEIAYDDRFELIQQSNCEIYSCLRDANNGEAYIYDLIYKTVSKTYINAPIVILVSTLLLIISIIYIIISIGHKNGYEGIYTNKLDKMPLEIVGIVIGVMLSIEGLVLVTCTSLVSSVTSSNIINTFIGLSLLTGIIVYITLAIAGITFIRRIKAKIFWKSTLLYKIVKWVKTIVLNIIEEIFKNPNKTFRLVVIFAGFTVISLILFVLAMDNSLWSLILLAFWYFTFKVMLNQINKLYIIRDKIRDMYNGNVQEKLNEEEFKGELKQIVVELNDISGGLSNAIEEGLKSERLKTELITNVSHDIKTPLTSIINYVDLLKKEDIKNKNVEEYLNVLESKSQRLKKLTEDLIEASKASSGNIKLNIEKLNVKQLIKQVSGEFEDKFKGRGLEIIESIPDEELYINADSRYMFRIMENMYTNISKYALENSRVYIDVEKRNDNITIVLKNISRDKLNITVDELMQRFVRGDSSRTTEGSGLGISIAKSLTELQNGKFNMYLDGDLFKVVLEFKTI